MQQIADNKDILTSVSFERYRLGENSALLLSNVSVVAPQIQTLGLETWYVLLTCFLLLLFSYACLLKANGLFVPVPARVHPLDAPGLQ